MRFLIAVELQAAGRELLLAAGGAGKQRNLHDFIVGIVVSGVSIGLFGAEARWFVRFEWELFSNRMLGEFRELRSTTKELHGRRNSVIFVGGIAMSNWAAGISDNEELLVGVDV